MLSLRDSHSDAHAIIAQASAARGRRSQPLSLLHFAPRNLCDKKRHLELVAACA